MLGSSDLNLLHVLTLVSAVVVGLLLVYLAVELVGEIGVTLEELFG